VSLLDFHDYFSRDMSKSGSDRAAYKCMGILGMNAMLNPIMFMDKGRITRCTMIVRLNQIGFDEIYNYLYLAHFVLASSMFSLIMFEKLHAFRSWNDVIKQSLSQFPFCR
jgi:hypothetical protein